MFKIITYGYLCGLYAALAKLSAAEPGVQPNHKGIVQHLLGKRAAATESITPPRGIHLRLRRSIQAEGSLPLPKNDFGFRRLLTTGKANVQKEMFFLALVFSLKKL